MKKWILFFGALSLIFLVGCSTTPTQPETSNSGNTISSSATLDWKEVSIKDVNSGETFKVSDFKGKPILLESFAVWCPTCTKQQREIKKLHEEVGDSVVSITLDTDPNEDEQKVIEHAQANGFDWRYAVSPPTLTQSLIDEFGVGVVNAPSAPVILICEDQSTRYLDRGVKSKEDLKSAIAQGC